MTKRLEPIPASRVLLVTAPLCCFAARMAGSGWVAILGGATCAWLYLVTSVRRTPRVQVVLALVLWAALFSLCTIFFLAQGPGHARLVPHGEAYWDEMRPWIETGIGRESTPSMFVPEHLLHLGAFAGLAAATAGWAGLALGAYLLMYMSYYVARAMEWAHNPAAALVAWHPWAVVRVVAFIVLGVSLSRLVIDHVAGRASSAPAGTARPRTWWREERFALALGLALWVLDLVLKITLAPGWPQVLRGMARRAG